MTTLAEDTINFFGSQKYHVIVCVSSLRLTCGGLSRRCIDGGRRQEEEGKGGGSSRAIFSSSKNPPNTWCLGWPLLIKSLTLE